MKILHIIASVSPEWGGPVEGIIRQDEILRQQEGSREIVSLDSPTDPWVAACPVKTYAMGIRSPFIRGLKRYIPWLRYGYTPHLAPWLKRNAGTYDAIIVNGLWNYSALAAKRALKDSPTPYAVFTHGMLDPWFKEAYPWKHRAKQVLWWFSEGPLLRHAAAVFFTTEDEKLLARNAFRPYHAIERVTGYGTADIQGDKKAQVAAFRATLPALGSKHFLLFLSRLHPKKGCDMLIRAFAKTAAQRPDLDLVIAGPDQVGWRNELVQIGRFLGVESRVHWPGMLTGDAKWGAYHAADAFILPSHQENFGIVVAEAMACSKPVFITDKINIWREVAECEGGIVAPDTQEGANMLLERFSTLSDYELQAMGRAAREGFLKYFEITGAAKNILFELNRLQKKTLPKEGT